MATTQIADVVVPEIFSNYVLTRTEEKNRIVRSGAMQRDPELDAYLQGAGLTFQMPGYNPLTNEMENISTDNEADRYTANPTPTDNSTPKKITTHNQVAVRLSRNESWSSSNLTRALSATDPMDAIADQVAKFWALRQQAATIAAISGVFAENAAGANDMEFDNSNGGTYVPGVTNFSAEAAIDTELTMGDSEEEFGMLFVHPIVKARMKKNNLIDYIPDARGEVMIPIFQGKEVIVDSAMPNDGSVFESWFLGSGALRLGQHAPYRATVTDWDEDAANGAGQEMLYNRTEWIIHPFGYAYSPAGIVENGGPDNTAVGTGLANPANWTRAVAERQMIKMARLITTER